MEVTVIQIVADALKTVPKGLEKRLGKLEIRGRIESIQTTARMRKRVPET